MKWIWLISSGNSLTKMSYERSPLGKPRECLLLAESKPLGSKLKWQPEPPPDDQNKVICVLKPSSPAVVDATENYHLSLKRIVVLTK